MRRSKELLAAIGTGVLLIAATPAHAQQDFCHDPRTDAERRICDDLDLAMLERAFERRHDRLLRRIGGTKKGRSMARRLRSALLDRRNDCGTDEWCIREAYEVARLTYLRIMGPPGLY